MRSFLRPKRIALLVVCLSAAALLLVLRSNNGAQWLSGPPPTRKGRLDFLGGAAGPIRDQWSRLKQRFAGSPKLIDVQAAIYEFEPSASLPSLPASAALTSQAGARVFVVPDGRAFDDQIKQSTTFQRLAGSRLMTANGMHGQMASYEAVPTGLGTNRRVLNVGWWLDIRPRARAQCVDLDCFLTGTEQGFRVATTNDPSGTNELFLRTNVAIGASVKIPTNGCLFLIASGTNRNGKAVGAVLFPVVWQTK